MNNFEIKKWSFCGQISWRIFIEFYLLFLDLGALNEANSGYTKE